MSGTQEISGGIDTHTVPTPEQTALDLTCALIAGGYVTKHLLPEHSAQAAVELLELLRGKLMPKG